MFLTYSIHTTRACIPISVYWRLGSRSSPFVDVRLLTGTPKPRYKNALTASAKTACVLAYSPCCIYRYGWKDLHVK